jgi:hypothetical protein
VTPSSASSSATVLEAIEVPINNSSLIGTRMAS